MDQPLVNPRVNPYRLAVGVLIPLGWVLVAVARPNNLGRWWPELWMAAILGIIFGHAALAAAWSALGPLPLAQRLPLSALWIGIVAIAFGFNLAQDTGDDGLITLAVFGGAVLLQWGVTQAPLWLVARRLRLRLTAPDEQTRAGGNADHQFGIRQIMVLTALVAFVLGAGRLMLGGLGSNDNGGSFQGVGTIMCLVVVNALLSLPVLAAVFLERRRLLAAATALGVVALCTAIEVPLLMGLMGQRAGAADYTVILGMRLVQSAWIFTVLGLLRAAGYRLVQRGEIR